MWWAHVATRRQKIALWHWDRWRKWLDWFKQEILSLFSNIKGPSSSETQAHVWILATSSRGLYIKQFSMSVESTVIWDCLRFDLLRSVIGPEISRKTLNQSDVEPKPRLCDSRFPRSKKFVCFYSDLSLANGDNTFTLVGLRGYYGFCFWTLDWKLRQCGLGLQRKNT